MRVMECQRKEDEDGTVQDKGTKRQSKYTLERYTNVKMNLARMVSSSESKGSGGSIFR